MAESFDATGIPHAHAFQLYFCGHCPSGHIVFLDRANQPILSATLSASQARQLANKIAQRDPNFREIAMRERGRR